MELFLLRAKYELDRIPGIRKKLLKEWRYEQEFNKKKDGLMAHMMAERQASIEGRLYFEAIKHDHTPSKDIHHLAEKELNGHGDKTEALSQKLSQKYFLLPEAATHCAKDILRYQETHGKKPSEDQVSTMVRIAKELENRIYIHPTKTYKSYQIEYLRRKEGDMFFRLYTQDKNLTSLENEQMQSQAKASLEATLSHIIHDFCKIAQREISL